MTLFKRIPLKVKEKDYEIRVLYDEKLVNVVAFFENHPANCFRYQVQIPKYLDARKLLEAEAVNHMIEIARSDLFENRWERLLQSVL